MFIILNLVTQPRPQGTFPSPGLQNQEKAR